MRAFLLPALVAASCFGQTFTTWGIPKGFSFADLTFWFRHAHVRSAGQNVIVGTGDPDVDIPAIQAAVDRGGHVVLAGRFSFDRPPAQWFEASGGRTVLVSREVVISGAQDEHGRVATVEGGTNPFAVEAPGVPVTIRGVRFVRPKGQAIMVRAVTGLVIADCRIEGLEPLPNPTAGGGGRYASGIYIGTTPTLFPPTPHRPGQPGNVSGTC